MTLFFTFIIAILAFIIFVYIPIYISWRYNDVRKQKINRVKMKFSDFLKLYEQDRYGISITNSSTILSCDTLLYRILYHTKYKCFSVMIYFGPIDYFRFLVWLLLNTKNTRDEEQKRGEEIISESLKLRDTYTTEEWENVRWKE